MSILIVEGGPNNFNDPGIIHPLLFLGNLAPTSKATLFYQGSAESQLGDRKLVVPSGGVLGGGSSIKYENFPFVPFSNHSSWLEPSFILTHCSQFLSFTRKSYANLPQSHDV